jgi:amino acid adenylation domain-containing protein
MSGSPIRTSTVQELLRARAAEPGGRGYVFLTDGEAQEARLSFADLHARASGIGAELRRRGLAGARALLLYAPGLDYITGFFGCLAAPAVAVPTYPPDPARIERSLRRLVAIVEDARPQVALTTRAVRAALQPAFGLAPALARLEWVATDEIDPAEEGDVRAAPEDVAFLQYTSGSTGVPKGVELTHRNLLHNSVRIQHAFGYGPGSRGVIWLPPYHDMGLIGGIVQPLYGGIDVVLMSPIAFLERPMRWLEAVSRWRGTVSGGPNFAYDLCVRKSSPAERAALDLSSWQVAFNGAEPVRAETLDRFVEAFAPAGFRREAFFPCYGLAESTLIATGGPGRVPPRVLRVRRGELARGRAVESAAGELALVGSGRPFADGPLAIVDPASGRRCAEDEVGEIWLAGDSVARGYFARPEETEEIFGARLDGETRFLRTGDLGFLHGGELFVAGRVKDLIIVRGRNHHPSDLEHTAERVDPAIRPGCAAAFQLGIDDPRVALVAELARQAAGADLGAIARAVRQAVAEEHELTLHVVVLVRAGTVPKTSSGKIERHSCRRAFLDGTLTELARDELGRAELGHELGVDDDGHLAFDTPAAAEAARGGAALRRYLVAHAARLLERAPSEIAPELPLTASGLDSLMALELQSLVETELGARVSASWLLGGPSLEAIAARVEEALASAGPESGESQAAPASDAGEFPLSPGQRALWFLQVIAPDSAAYNVWVAGRAAGPVDEAALRGAFQRLVDRHPPLRASVFLRDGVPWQRVAPRSVDLALVDATGMPEERVREEMAAEAHRPFDLGTGVFRVRLYRAAHASWLLVVAHHVAVDLWSAGLLLGELAGGGPAAAARAYADHVAGEEGRLVRGDDEAAWAYWRQKLAGPLPALELPLDQARPRRQSFRGATRSFDLDAAVVTRLRQLARDEETTLYAVLLSAFAALLGRLSGQEDVLVGSPSAGRRPGFEQVVGYFVNPIPLRADLSGEPSFRQLVRRSRAVVLEALEHASLPFPLLVERLAIARPLDRAPLFQAMFALERAHVGPALGGFLAGAGAPVDVAGTAFEPITLEQRASGFDVALVMVEHDGRLRGSFQVDAELFFESTAGRWGEQFQTLSADLAADPDRAVADARLAGDDQVHRTLVEWNRTGSTPAGPLFRQMIQEQARRRPEAPALVMAGTTVSYAEMEARVADLAARLRALDVGPERVVAVLLERSIDWALAVLAVFEAGGIYLPLDPDLPDERMRFMIEDSAAIAAVTSRALEARLGGVPALRVDDAAGPMAAAGPSPALTPDSAAYIIYTSGSTGRPKGVVTTHRGVCNLVAAQRQTFGLGEDERILQYSSCSFDVSVFELAIALTNGAALHIVPASALVPGPELVRLLQEGAVTFMLLSPGVLGLLPAAELPAVRTVISGADVCPAELVARWAPGRRFYNGYGPTETTVWATIAPLDAMARGKPPIGKPIANLRAYVLDRKLRPAPVGAVGELYFGGASLARGYKGRPALTAERFIPDPFGPPGERLYRTGDLVRFLDDGSIDFLGRTDDQVKIRGYRVEPGEVEAALRGHPGVRDVSVIARPDRRGERRLVAYLVGDEEHRLDELRSFLRGRGLPDYLLPTALVQLPALPRTAGGKVDRRALPEPAEPARVGPVAPPTSRLEEQLLGAFREVLGHDQIGVHDHFFEVLGGSSLAVVRACALLDERERIQVPVTAVFEYPTVHELALHLGRASAARGPAGPSHEDRARARAAAVKGRLRNRPT